MTLDELAGQIRSVSDEKAVQRLADLLLSWKDGQDTAEELRGTIEHYIGNIWIEKDEDHRRIYSLWSAFRDETIAGIGGMTMNERLCRFGLTGRFDACRDRQQKLAVYAKLQARP